MKLKFAPIKKRQRSILLTFLLLLTLPVFVFSILENRSFDIRNKASEEIELSTLNPCIITFPNVNPYTIEVNSTVRIQVDALSEKYNIKSITISDTVGNQIFSKSYQDTQISKVAESFIYSPTVAKSYNLVGTLVDKSDKTYACIVSSQYSVQGVKAILTNSKPEFLTSPKDSKPSQSIQTGITYEYTLEAEDIDKDTINYAYSFTKGQTWLKATVIDDGGDGKLTIKFKGSTNQPGSYLANVFIHDGYSKHLSSQSWVISVSPKGNDNPVVTIIEPEKSITLKDEKTLKVSWEAVDNNEITKYEIYISSNPVNELTWKSINTNIPPTQNSYNIDLTDITNGTYRVIVRAFDNQTPAGVGMDVSEEIIISKTNDEPKEPDDKVVLPQPQIINVSPTNTDEISNTTPTVRASLIATENAKIDEASILVKIDDKDITKDIKINKISDSEYTVIYTPESSLDIGLHKFSIYFKDSNDRDIEKEWTFTILGQTEDGDTFNIFGFEIPKRTGYIIGGGIGLIALAILIPLVIMAIWKDNSKEISTENTVLPASMPKTDNSFVPDLQSKVEDLVQDTTLPPEPEIETSEIPEPDIDAVFEAPQPEDSFANMYNTIKEIEKEDKKETK